MRFLREKMMGRCFAQAEEGRHGCGESRRRHGGGGRLGRFFAHGDLRFVILKLISEKPSHGYEIIKAIEEGVAGAYSPSPGVIYPTLTLLEELGWVRVVESRGSRKQFEITPEGGHALEANRNTVEAIFGRMAEVREKGSRHDEWHGRRGGRGRRGHGDGQRPSRGEGSEEAEAPQLAPAIEAALGSLRAALARGEASPAKDEAIATILSDAARRIAEA